MNASKNYLKLQPNIPVVVTPQFRSPLGPYESDRYKNMDGTPQTQYLYRLVDEHETEWSYYCTPAMHAKIEAADYWDLAREEGKPLCLTKVVGPDRRTTWSVKVAHNGQWVEVQAPASPTPAPAPAAPPASSAPNSVPPPAEPTPPPTVPPATPQSVSEDTLPSVPPAQPPRDDQATFRAMYYLMGQCYLMANLLADTAKNVSISECAHSFFIEANRKGLKATVVPQAPTPQPPTPQPAVPPSTPTPPSPPSEEPAPPAQAPAPSAQAPAQPMPPQKEEPVDLDKGAKRKKAFKAAAEALMAQGVGRGKMQTMLLEHGLTFTSDPDKWGRLSADQWVSLPQQLKQLLQTLDLRPEKLEAATQALDGIVVKPPSPNQPPVLEADSHPEQGDLSF